MGGYRHFYKHVLLFKWMLHVNGVSLTDSSPFLFLGFLFLFCFDGINTNRNLQ